MKKYVSRLVVMLSFIAPFWGLTWIAYDVAVWQKPLLLTLFTAPQNWLLIFVGVLYVTLYWPLTGSQRVPESLSCPKCHEPLTKKLESPMPLVVKLTCENSKCKLAQKN